ncbi:CAAX protease self-immunity [Rubrobacter radiotolerans]|uniref:CAAX protease self-immunity n=1 Tax=Rubrobacter radiotolerans TaxID=42256 RepID=A0A023X1T6_RUBRA|nr:CPBP family intramembrane glutamic endopeptidase [Rubrobacter radiotolerans]AHY46432.1 CAAX protease self-immunity [Rubrobacter radiotolerans]MDX5893839.1 CPBP family intramembrane glutamic endopeptidase [Rubrobacter radiotolerans]SMC04601.1 hypothetical protein SAMN00767673_1146 [Rubrobacter radiotolerans DSM 5868]
MAEVLLTLVLALFVGGLGMVAQVARKSRQAAVTLAVVLLGASVLVSLLGLFVGIGLFVQFSGGETFGITGAERVAYAAAIAAVVVAGVAGVALCVPLFRRVLGREVRSRFWADPVVVFALWLAVLVLANNVVSFLIFTVESDVTSLFPDGRVSPGLLVSSQLPFVIVAVMGVGFLVRRNLRETLARLGYGGISLKQFGVVALFVVGALAASFGTDALFRLVQPDLYQQVGELSDALFSPVGLSPLSAILFALLIGIGAGLGEETLFRGAVQPVFGIVFTSIIFASMHIQYGPSLLLVYIFVLSVGLGYLRKHINTTASFLAHASYNTLSVLLAYFVGGA